MAQKMMAYLEEQTVVWISMVKNRNTLFSDFAKVIRTRKINRILMIGTGSSYHALEMAAVFMEDVTGIEITTAIPTRMGSLAAHLSPETTLVMAASQSGSSTSTAKAAMELMEKGFFVIGITAEPESQIARDCSFHQLISCGEESVGPKTKGMTGTVLTLYLMGIILGKEIKSLTASRENSLLKLFIKSFEAAPENILRSRMFCEKHKETFAAKPDFTLVSDGMSYLAAKEGALKILETLYVPCVAYEFEEYLHGVNNTIEPELCNILMPNLPENLSRMKRLDRYCRKAGCTNFVITSVPWEQEETVLQLLGTTSQYTVPFEILLAFQVMSVYGSEQKGIECDRPKFIDFYSLMETKLPIQ